MNRFEWLADVGALDFMGWVAVAVASGLSLAGLIAVVGGNEVALLALIVGFAVFTFGIGLLAAGRHR